MQFYQVSGASVPESRQVCVRIHGRACYAYVLQVLLLTSLIPEDRAGFRREYAVRYAAEVVTLAVAVL